MSVYLHAVKAESIIVTAVGCSSSLSEPGEDHAGQILPAMVVVRPERVLHGPNHVHLEDVHIYPSFIWTRGGWVVL